MRNRAWRRAQELKKAGKNSGKEVTWKPKKFPIPVNITPSRLNVLVESCSIYKDGELVTELNKNSTHELVAHGYIRKWTPVQEKHPKKRLDECIKRELQDELRAI